MRLLIISMIGIIFLSACSKAAFERTNPAYGELSLYNASWTLETFLPTGGGTGKKVLIPLSPLTKTPMMPGSWQTPYFSQVTGEGKDFPYVNWYYDVPWSSFDQYAPADYTASVHLGSQDSASLFTFPVNIEKDKRRTWFLSDSLGVFHVTTITHEKNETAGAVMLRFIQLCPDADSVNIRIGTNLLTGLQNMPYRYSSGYVSYPLAADSTLKLRVFNAGDTLNVIGRKDLPAVPGQSYVIVFRNYRMAHQYKGAGGKTINVIPGGALDVRKIQ